MEKENIKKKAPTSRDWDRVRALYMRGETLDTIKNALPKVKLSKRAIVAKMEEEGVRQKRDEINGAVINHLQKNIEKEKIRVNNTCINLFNTGAEVINHLLAQYLNEVKSGDVPKMKAKATAYNVDMLMSGITKVQKGLRVCYGMDEDGNLFEKEPEVLVIDGLDTNKI